MKLSSVLSVAVTLGMLATVPGAVLAQSNPRVGTWKLNLAKSKFDPGPPPKSQTRTYEAVGDGQKLSVDGVDANGNPVTYGYTAKLDGKDYPITGSGAPGDTIAIKRIDELTVELTPKKGGKVVQTTKSVVSKDGKMLTLTSTGTDSSGRKFTNVQVFDKQ